MFEKSNLLILNNLKSDLKKNKSALICSFIVGFVMGSIPFIHKSIENFRIQKLIQEEKKIQRQNKEIICYCQVGERASHTFLALKICGYPDVKIYDKSFADWSNNSNMPIEI